jgi:hypothetical protein
MSRQVFQVPSHFAVANSCKLVRDPGMAMKVAVFGLGYVGSVTAAPLALLQVTS